MLDELTKQIRSSPKPAGLNVRLVAIDGHGGSGKSTLAQKLADALGCEVIHTDDFASYDNPMEWWPRLIDEVLDPIKSGAKSLSYKRSSWYKTHQPDPVIDQLVTDIVIIEGVSASRPEFAEFLSYKIWVETPIDISTRRGIARDLLDNSAHKSYAEIQNDWTKWHRYELEYVARNHPREHADVVVDGTVASQ